MSTAQLMEKTSMAPSDEKSFRGEIHTFCTFRNAMLPQCNTEAGEGRTGPPAPKQGLLSIVELLSQRHYPSMLGSRPSLQRPACTQCKIIAGLQMSSGEQKDVQTMP